MKVIPTGLTSLYKKPQAQSEEDVDFIPFMRVDYEQEGFKVRVKKDDTYQWVNIWTELKIQILLITQYYNCRDNDKNKTTIETSKILPWQDITVYDYNAETYTTMSSQEFKQYKAKQKAEGNNLKFSRSLIVKILEGEYKDQLFELTVKLSQSHGVDNNRRYMFDDPIEGGLAQYLEACEQVYPSRILEMEVRSYSRGPITIKFPHLTMTEEVDINEEEVNDAIARTKESDKHREKNLSNSILSLD